MNKKTRESNTVTLSRYRVSLYLTCVCVCDLDNNLSFFKDAFCTTIKTFSSTRGGSGWYVLRLFFMPRHDRCDDAWCKTDFTFNIMRTRTIVMEIVEPLLLLLILSVYLIENNRKPGSLVGTRRYWRPNYSSRCIRCFFWSLSIIRSSVTWNVWISPHSKNENFLFFEDEDIDEMVWFPICSCGWLVS